MNDRSGNRMNDIILGHAGGLDEMAILLFPVVAGLGAWLLTRQPNRRRSPRRISPIPFARARAMASSG
jgi:hypothetical protein